MSPETTEVPQPPPARFVITRYMKAHHKVNVQEIRPDGTRVFNSHVGIQHPNLHVAKERILRLYPGADVKIEV